MYSSNNPGTLRILEAQIAYPILICADSAVYGHSDKRRGKPLTFNQSINYQLDDSDILDDLKIINKNKAFSMHSSR